MEDWLGTSEDDVDDSVADGASAITEDEKLVDDWSVDIGVETSVEEDSVETTWLVDAIDVDGGLIVEET